MSLNPGLLHGACNMDAASAAFSEYDDDDISSEADVLRLLLHDVDRDHEYPPCLPTFEDEQTDTLSEDPDENSNAAAGRVCVEDSNAEEVWQGEKESDLPVDLGTRLETLLSKARGGSHMRAYAVYAPPIIPLPSNYSGIVSVSMQDWVAATGCEESEVTRSVLRFRDLLASGRRKIKGLQCVRRQSAGERANGVGSVGEGYVLHGEAGCEDDEDNTADSNARASAPSIVILPESVAEDFQTADEKMHACNWMVSSTKATNEYFYCSASRMSRAANAMIPKKKNRVLPHVRSEDGTVSVQHACPFRCVVIKTGGLSFLVMDSHSHPPDLQKGRFQQTDENIIQFIVDKGREGVGLAHIVKMLHAAYILEFEKSNIPVSITDKRIFVSYRTASELYRRRAKGAVRLSDSDVVEVKIMAERFPQTVRLLQPYNVTDGAINSHLLVHVGSSAGLDAYRQYGANGLVLLDATHKFNNYGYRTFSLMTVVFGANGKVRESRICGHLITSDLSAKAIEKWLLDVFLPLGEPKEVIIDVDATEQLALRTAFPCAHIAYCYFHCVKAIVENFKGLSKPRKVFFRARIRRVFLAKTQEEFDSARKSLDAVLDTLPPSSRAYWDKNWESKIKHWSPLERRFPAVRTTNFLESLHMFMKFSPMGANRMFIRRIGDAIRTLANVDYHRSFQALLKGVGRVTCSGSAQQALARARGRARGMMLRAAECSCVNGTTCPCNVQLVIENLAQGMFTVAHHGNSYDVNMHRMQCACEAFEMDPSAPCKHMVFVADMYDKFEGQRKAWTQLGQRATLSAPASEDRRLSRLLVETFLDPPLADAIAVGDRHSLTRGLLEWAHMFAATNQLPSPPVSLQTLGYTHGTATGTSSSDDAGESCGPAPSLTDDTSLPEGLGGDEPPDVRQNASVEGELATECAQSRGLGPMVSTNASEASARERANAQGDALQSLISSVTKHGTPALNSWLAEYLEEVNSRIAAEVPQFHVREATKTKYAKVATCYGAVSTAQPRAARTSTSEDFTSISRTRRTAEKRHDSIGPDLRNARLDDPDHVGTIFANLPNAGDDQDTAKRRRIKDQRTSQQQSSAGGR